MPREEAQEKLNNAAALLNMLERLHEELGRTAPVGSGVPWKGMKLTLAQCRDCLAQVQDELEVDSMDNYQEDISADVLIKKSPLAKRIRKMPLRRRKAATSSQQ